jgi:hypothetical protein
MYFEMRSAYLLRPYSGSRLREVHPYGTLPIGVNLS